MDWILSQAVASWLVISHIVSWSLENPGAAAFWGGTLLTLVNYVVKWTPTQVDDSLLDAIITATKNGLEKARSKK